VTDNDDQAGAHLGARRFQQIRSGGGFNAAVSEGGEEPGMTLTARSSTPAAQRHIARRSRGIDQATLAGIDRLLTGRPSPGVVDSGWCRKALLVRKPSRDRPAPPRAWRR